MILTGFRGWIVEFIVDLILANLKDEVIKDFADKLTCLVVPKVREFKAEIMARLYSKAEETETVLDNVLYRKIDIFLDSFIPDTRTCLIDLDTQSSADA